MQWFKKLFRNRWKEYAIRKEKDCENYTNALKQTRFERDEYKRKFEAQCKLSASLNADVRDWKEKYSQAEERVKTYQVKFENSQSVVARLRNKLENPEAVGEPVSH
jgi:chromosome segregation ATPase